jgi:carbamoylphosphate synthase large subunit
MLFFVFKKIQFELVFPKKKKILFSYKEDWIEKIKIGFKFTNQVVVFEKFSRDNIINYDLIVPLTVEDLLLLNEARDLVKNNSIPIPKNKSIIICHNKSLFNQTLIDKGFGKYIPNFNKNISLPYILKKKIDVFGKNSHIIASSLDEKKHAKIMLDSNYFKQELIGGFSEYATHILFKNHKIIYALNIRYVFEKEFPIKGKDKPVYTKICFSSYLDIFSSILESIDFEGLCCVNYKIQNDLPKIFEINPRFGGSLAPYFFDLLKYLK